MKNSICREKFLNQLKEERLASPFPKIITAPYNWLSSRLDRNGALVDNFVKSALDHQYHTPWFIFSSAVMYAKMKDDTYKQNLESSLNYLIKINYKANKTANSFIGIPMILSSCFISDEKILQKIRDYVVGIAFSPEHESDQANNFHCMKVVALLLKQKVLNIELNQNESRFIENIIQHKLSEWQFEDGIFFDKPYTSKTYRGIPHLTYHSTITMLTLLSGILLENISVFERGVRGIKALDSLVSPSGEAGAYGRSNNAIFGQSSAIFAISIYQMYAPNGYDALRTLLIDYMHRYLAEDGHIFIVPNQLEKKRRGFDKYMFVSVYESWTLGFLLLSHLIQPLTVSKGRPPLN